jgi:hypothetical protein
MDGDCVDFVGRAETSLPFAVETADYCSMSRLAATQKQDERYTKQFPTVLHIPLSLLFVRSDAAQKLALHSTHHKVCRS